MGWRAEGAVPNRPAGAGARDRSVTGTERPVDVLDGDPELVVEAASRLAAEILI